MTASSKAPDRTNFQALSTSRRSSPTRWNSSVKTASDVSNGKCKDENVSTQRRCQRSLRSSRAKIAPVSIRALTRMFAAEALSNGLLRGFGAPRIAAGEVAETSCCGALETLLARGIVRIAVAVLQPFLRGEVERCRKRDLAAAGLALQVRFQVGGNAPAINLSLHALHCSAWSRARVRR